MISVLKKSVGLQFADDTAIIVGHRDLNTAIKTAQSEFDEISRWCHDNRLVINSKKTKFMHIRPPHIPRTEIKLKIHNTDCLHENYDKRAIDPNDLCNDLIENVSSYRYLGVEVDYNFKWDSHIERTCKRLRQSLFAILHLSNYTSFSVLKQAYFSLVESVIQYGIVAWGNTSRYFIENLQRIQNRFFKILLKAKYGARYVEHSQNASNELGLLTVHNLFLFNMVNEMYNDQRFKQPIQHDINTRRRAQGYLEVPRIHNSYGRQQLAYVVPRIFNGLPRELWHISNEPMRKKRLKRYLLENRIILN